MDVCSGYLAIAYVMGALYFCIVLVLRLSNNSLRDGVHDRTRIQRYDIGHEEQAIQLPDITGTSIRRPEDVRTGARANGS